MWKTEPLDVISINIQRMTGVKNPAGIYACLLFCFFSFAQNKSKHSLYAQYNKAVSAYNFVNGKGKIVLQSPSFYYYAEATNFAESDKYPDSTVAAVFIDRKGWRLIKRNGEILNDSDKIRYDRIELVQNCFILRKNYVVAGISNAFGKTIIPCDHYSAGYVGNVKPGTVFPIGKNHKWGAVNPLGDTIIPFIYDTISGYYNSLEAPSFFVFKKGAVSYLYNFAGKLLFQQTDLYCNPKEWATTVAYNDFEGVIDPLGKWILKPDTSLHSVWLHSGFGDKIIQAYSGEDYASRKVILYDSLGKQLLAPLYTNVEFHADYLIGTFTDDKDGLKRCALLDKTGKTKIPPKYNTLKISHYNYNKLIVAGKTASNGNYTEALLNDTGKILIPFLYASIKPLGYIFNRVLVQDVVTRKYGAVDLTGKLVIDCVFDTDFDFNQDNRKTAYTKLNGKNAAIDVNGKVLFSFADAPGFSHESHGLLIAYERVSHHHGDENNFGIYTLNGKKIIGLDEHRYLAVPSKGGVILCSKKRYWGSLMLMDSSGRKLDTIDNIGLSYFKEGDAILSCVNCSLQEQYDRAKDDHGLIRFKGGKAAVIVSLDFVKVPRFYQFFLNRQLLKRMKRKPYSSQVYVFRENINIKKTRAFHRKIKRMKKMPMKKYLSL
ncbi:MAG: WG repeat-containing protein [Bacteroidia bacterium]|nr:WG repeat-containing protein [Bacteroidia bacterium]